MDNVEKFLEAVRQAAPGMAAMVNARAAVFKGQPMQLLSDLVQRSVLPRSRLHQLWADTLGVAAVSPTTIAISTDSYEQLPLDIARLVNAIVLTSIGDTATVAMADPANSRHIESIAKILGKKVSPVFAHPAEIATVIDMYLGNAGDIAVNLQSVCDQLPDLIGAREIATAEDVADLVETKAVIELLNSII